MLPLKFKKINGALKHVERGVAHRVFQAVQRYVESYPVFAAGSAEKDAASGSAAPAARSTVALAAS